MVEHSPSETLRSLLEIIDENGVGVPLLFGSAAHLEEGIQATSTSRSCSSTFDDWREGARRVDVSDSSRTQSALHWLPRIPFEEGVNRYFVWCHSLNEEW